MRIDIFDVGGFAVHAASIAFGFWLSQVLPAVIGKDATFRMFLVLSAMFAGGFLYRRAHQLER